MSSTVVDAPAPFEPRSEERQTRVRLDIQGLRAIAVGLVLLYHAGAPFLPGGYIGVDVFFVISGFLITKLLVKEAAQNGRISLRAFYARRARRILPAATVVLLAVSITTVLMLPRTRTQDISWQILGSATYVVNWFFANSVNYLNSEDAESPLLHFWTLAVEEQFYIVWPLLLVILIYFARPRSMSGLGGRRLRIDQRTILTLIGAGIGTLTALSLAWSIYYTPVNPGVAYFVTTTRLWELGLGAMVAVFARFLVKTPPAIAAALGWIGLGSILLAGHFYTAQTPFPGYAALVPTIGATMIIIGGLGGHLRVGVGVLLSLKPMTWVGDTSYSLYLWHWPLIVIGTYLLNDLSFSQGLAIVTLSVVPAYLSYRFVELPILRSERLSEDGGRTLQFGGALMVVNVLVAVSMLLYIPGPVSPSADSSQFPVSSGGSDVRPLMGAGLLGQTPSAGKAVDSIASFIPAPVDAQNDVPPLYRDGCHQEANEDDVPICIYGRNNSRFTIAIVGDSHAAQWAPAIIQLAQNNGWRVATYTKAGCPLIKTAIIRDGSGEYKSCTSWNRKVIARLTGSARPNFVLLGGSNYQAHAGSSVVNGEVNLMASGYAMAWDTLRSAGVGFAVLNDTPKSGINTPECVLTNSGNLSACATSAQKSQRDGDPNQLQAARQTGDSLINLNSRICPEDPCAPIIGGVLVYRDAHHLTATYSRSLAPALGKELRRYAIIPFAALPAKK